ncbi:hypothetical protein FRC12_018078 [Ceratobasidium sp. 428]|nr:hypothetical protein FRC12_018078 [Ceratobasidium sp. 428]
MHRNLVLIGQCYVRQPAVTRRQSSTQNHHRPMDIPMSPLASAMKTWKATHDQLVQAINTYTNACTALHASLLSVRPSFHEDSSQFEAALLITTDELKRFEQVLNCGIIAGLSKIRNLSCTLAPINVLPQFLLRNIFAYLLDSKHIERTHFPNFYHEPKFYDPILAISAVCASWRQLILDNPIFWSIIWFHPKDPTHRFARLSLARVGNAPMDIQAPILERHDWLEHVRPKCHQVRSLDLCLPDMDSLRATLAIWPQDSPASSLKSLSVKVRKTKHRVDISPPKMLPDGTPEKFLQNVTSFSLYGGYFDWDSAVFAGLEHLEMAWVAEPGLTPDQIAGILRASPRLRTLCLGEIPIAEQEHTTYPPVKLEYLQKLSFLSFTHRELELLAALLLPGPQPLTLHLRRILEDESVPNSFSRLLRCSNIESIHFHDESDDQVMSDILAVVPQLRSIYCRYNSIPKMLDVLSTPLSTGSTENPISLPCPQIRMIHFDCCRGEGLAKPSKSWITDQPSLVVRFQGCHSLPAQLELSNLAHGEVLVEQIDPYAPVEPMFDGIDSVMPSLFI